VFEILLNNLGNIILAFSIVFGGVMFINSLSFRLSAIEKELSKLSEVVITIARQEERMNSLDQRMNNITMRLEKLTE